MAHPEQRNFVKTVRHLHPRFFKGVRILEVGSYNVNGTIRDLFESCDYRGIDVAAGPGVDTVSPGHEWWSREPYDTVISTEAFEHDMHFPATLRNIVDNLLRPGGLFVFTCATTGRGEHGTPRTTPQDSPATQGLGAWSTFYQNRTEADVRAIIDVNRMFSVYGFSTNESTKDLYFWGVKVLPGNVLIPDDDNSHLPLVSCICLTYGRAGLVIDGRAQANLYLLEEAIESFLRCTTSYSRTSPGAEMVVLNDCPGQELKWDDDVLINKCNLNPDWVREHIRLINMDKRFATLGEKYNAAVGEARGDLILCWEDDDISLPWRINQAVEMMIPTPLVFNFWNPQRTWYMPGGELYHNHNHGVCHNASVFRKSAWEQVGGYPAISDGQDAVFDRRLRELGPTPPPLPDDPRLWAYIYRFGVSPVHLSGRAPLEKWYQEVGRLKVVEGSFMLRPHWRIDYERLCKQYASAVAK